jgi:parallel beta-helix repeat protein
MFAQSPSSTLSKKVFQFALIAFSCAAVSQAGTVDIHPGQDIPNIVAQNPGGTTFIIYPGTYRLTAHIVPKTGDQFIGQTACVPPRTSCPAILSGSRLIGSLAKLNGNNYEVTGQTQQGFVSQPNKICEGGYLACNLPEDLFFDGVPYRHLYASSLPSIGPKQWWFDYANHIIYFHDNPSGHTVETSVLDSAFRSSANNVTVQYLTIKGFASPIQRAGLQPSDGSVIPTSSANWVVKNCEIYNNHAAGVRLAFGMQVYNSYVHDNGTLGITGGLGSTISSGIVIQGNTISRNNYAKVNPAAGAGGYKVGETANVVLRGNTITNNDGPGIHFDATSTGVVDGNVITDNGDGAGVAYEISVNSTLVRNNIILRNGIPMGNPGSVAGVGSYASVGEVSYCNVIEVPNAPGANGFLIVGSDRGYNVVSPFEYLMSRGNSFHHNTLFWDAGSTGVVGYWLADPTRQPNFFSNNPPPDYNEYHLTSSSAANFIYDNNTSGKNSRKTFSQYQAAGADIHGSADAKYSSGFPTVAITSPADQSRVSGSVAVQATAADKSGINRVEFYVDWNLKTTVAGPPYNFTWTNGTTGTHIVTAMAYSNAGIRSCFAVTLNHQ